MSEIIDTPAEGFPLPTMDDRSERRKVLDVLTRLTPGAKARAVQRAEARLSVEGPDPEVNTFVEGVINEPGVAERITQAAVRDLFGRETGIPFTMDVDTDRDPSVITTIPGYTPHTNHPCSTVPLFDPPVTAESVLDGSFVRSILDGEIERRIAGFDPTLSDRLASTFDADPALERHPSGAALWREVAIDPTGIVDGLRESMRAQADHDLANAFDAGRAYERGATLRRNVGAKSLGSRRVQAQGIAADYLRDDPERGALHAAMVLAGFTGADPATVTA